MTDSFAYFKYLLLDWYVQISQKVPPINHQRNLLIVRCNQQLIKTLDIINTYIYLYKNDKLGSQGH